MAYYLIVAFQAFCIYHLIKNRNDYYWIFLIIFLPLIGCIIYLVTQVYNKRDANKIQENITNILVPTKRVNDLKKQLEFSDTYQNKVNLADAYFEMNDFENAIKYYEDAIKDESQNNYFLKAQLVKANYHAKNYKQAVAYANAIKKDAQFKKSKTQFTYGLALEQLGEVNAAEEQLKAIDVRYDNYNERLVLAKFLINRNKTNEAKVLLEEISDEAKHMTKPNKQKFRSTVAEVEKLLKNM
ncbi:tetratricopeptide repeat protein [Lacinutrix sp. MedPE-SW]|uniref:tetratricopeptide repeat protein n=1 Tax=Lacinutrix sp. MedPE-SW TaxID=1860087 RepID=UPI00091D97C4|nr:tetratricopeptide repeat protein [Lacinutrix sp. MedPE-SW]OIQ18798.1 MAG: hypothetical protein BM549_11590 [Lacinutrix sp. MedPE-SW]